MTANGTACHKARIQLPRIGAWHADLVIDALDASNFEGQVTLSIADGRIQLQGTALRYGVQYGVVMARVIGGGAGLGTILAAKSYQNATVKTVLSDICSAAGENLSSVADPKTIATQLPFWNRFSLTAGRAIQAVLENLGVAWRVVADGSIFVGPDTYPPTSMKGALILDTAPEQNRLDFYADVPKLFPGEGWNGRSVSRVEHNFTEDQLRSRVWFEDVP